MPAERRRPTCQIIQRFATAPQIDGVDNCLQSPAGSFLNEDTLSPHIAPCSEQEIYFFRQSVTILIYG